MGDRYLVGRPANRRCAFTIDRSTYIYVYIYCYYALRTDYACNFAQIALNFIRCTNEGLFTALP